MFKQLSKAWFSAKPEIVKTEPVKSISIDLGPNDILVVHCEKVISSDFAEHIKTAFENALEEGQKVWVLPPGLSYSVIKRTK